MRSLGKVSLDVMDQFLVLDMQYSSPIQIVLRTPKGVVEMVDANGEVVPFFVPFDGEPGHLQQREVTMEIALAATKVELLSDAPFTYRFRWFPRDPRQPVDGVSLTVQSTDGQIDPALARMVALERMRQAMEDGRTPGLVVDDFSSDGHLIEDFPFDAEDTASVQDEPIEGGNDADQEDPPDETGSHSAE